MVKVGDVVGGGIVDGVGVHLVDDGVVLDQQVVVGTLLLGVLFGHLLVLLNLSLHLVHHLEALVYLGGVTLSVHV